MQGVGFKVMKFDILQNSSHDATDPDLRLWKRWAEIP